MASYTQDQRVGELKPPPGLDGLVLQSFTATEGISELFEIRVHALSEDKGNLDLGKALGKMATVTYHSYGGDKRYFSGLLADARHDEGTANAFGYLLVLRPPAWFLSKRINSRAFQNKTVSDVIDKVLKDNNVDHSLNLQGSYPQLEYIVQHRESDLAFVQRLMEAHGIRFHFEFGDGSCKMVLSDGTPSDLPGKSKRTFAHTAENHPEDEEFISQWRPQRRFTAAKVQTSDYNFLTSTTDLKAEKTASVPFEMKLEEYEELYNQHLAKEAKPPKGQEYAQIRLDMRRSEDDRQIAWGDAVGLIPGFVMQLDKHPDFGGRYLIVRCTHQYTDQSYTSGEGQDREYSGIYELLPEKQQFRPAMLTPKPIIAGVQTGKVLGGEKDDKDIDVDEYGRILVHMHWNLDSPTKPEGQTMRCRVVQSWAGTNWGTMFIPRKGMEVLVQYVDGDPDRPVVIGCVYNDKHMPPYKLEGDKNIAGWKSRSTEGGGDDNYNEFIFDDTKGSELVRFNAEKDLESTIENDETRTIKKGNREATLEMGNDTRTLKMGNDSLTLNLGNHSTELNVGMYNVKCDVGPITIESMSMITLKVGTNQIIISQAGIIIQGLNILADAQATLTTHAKLTNTHLADTVATIHGLLGTVAV